ncbi:MAG: hypothetical protein JNK79_08440 [Chitinophagaceae bacterium]|nr:hypothetical protein [Chitinophagaceae bacterium]
MMKINGFIKASLFLGGMLFTLNTIAQELYVFTEPASNMPSKSVSIKLAAKLGEHEAPYKFMQRYTPELMFGLNKNWMVHFAPTFSNMFTSNQRWESVRTYAKYRFYSNDEVHRHFRMAAFGKASYSRNLALFDEINIEGDQSGIEGGVILTQLWNRLALSSTLGYAHSMPSKKAGISLFLPDDAFDFSLSAGYLVFPLNYTSYNQTNLNVYAELIGQRSLDMKKYVIDFAPAIQLIFNSNLKINFGYRFELKNSYMYRMMPKTYLVSIERTFLKVW